MRSLIKWIAQDCGFFGSVVVSDLCHRWLYRFDPRYRSLFDDAERYGLDSAAALLERQDAASAVNQHQQEKGA